MNSISGHLCETVPELQGVSPRHSGYLMRFHEPAALQFRWFPPNRDISFEYPADVCRYVGLGGRLPSATSFPFQKVTQEYNIPKQTFSMTTTEHQSIVHPIFRCLLPLIPTLFPSSYRITDALSTVPYSGGFVHA